MENVISEVCQQVPGHVANEDAKEKVQYLRRIIAQLECDNNILNALVHLDTPPEQVVERKSAIHVVVTQLEEMDPEAKKVTEVTT